MQERSGRLRRIGVARKNALTLHALGLRSGPDALTRGGDATFLVAAPPR